MPYCVECGKKIDEDDEFCQECGAKTKHKKKEEEPKVVEKVVEREYHHETPRSSGFGKFILFLILLGIIGFVVFMVIQSGELDEIFSGSGVPYVDPCEREFNECNHACGEGWLSGACKEKCSYQYRKCKS